MEEWPYVFQYFSLRHFPFSPLVPVTAAATSWIAAIEMHNVTACASEIERPPAQSSINEGEDEFFPESKKSIQWRPPRVRSVFSVERAIYLSLRRIIRFKRYHLRIG